MRLRAILASGLLAACSRADRETVAPTCSQPAATTTCLVTAVDRIDPWRGRVELMAGTFTRGQHVPLPGALRLRMGDRELRPTEVRRLRAVGEARGEDWTPPLAAGIVYLWAKGTTPPGIHSGVSFLAESLPPGARVCPKSYGQHHYEMACLPAYHLAAGSLQDDQHPGQFVHFLKAARQALREVQGLAHTLAEDGRRPIQWLVVITDGRDHERGTEGEEARRQTRRAFAELGADLRQSGVWTQVISFPCPGDRPECGDNVAALVQAAGAAHFFAADEGQVEDRIRRAALAWLEMSWVAVDLPWSARLLSSSDPAWLEVRLSDGPLAAPLGSLLAPGRHLRPWSIGLFALSVGGLILLGLRRRLRDLASSDRRFYSLLAEAFSAGLSPRATSRRVRGLLADAAWRRFARMSTRQLRGELERQPAALAELAGTAGQRFARETVRALREGLENPLAAAWLVVVSGPRSGETCRLPVPLAVLGTASTATWLRGLGSELGLRAGHAEIATLAGRFFLRPLDGGVAIEGVAVVGERELADGDRLALGGGEVVFKCVGLPAGT